MFTDVVVRSAKRLSSPKFAAEMANAFAIPADVGTVASIQDIFSKDYEFADFLIDVESRQFVDRVRNSGVQLSEQFTTLDGAPSQSNERDTHSVSVSRPTRYRRLLDYLPRRLVQRVRHSGVTRFEQRTTKDELQAQSNERDTPPVNVPKLIRYRWLLDYLPRQIEARKTFTGNVRLENVGISTLSSHAHPPIFIAYRWRTFDGKILSHKGHWTPLPIDLLPSRQLTVPMLIQTPDCPGRYLLEITLVQEDICWLDDGAKTIPIEIVAHRPPDLTAKWQVNSLAAESYFADHLRGLELLKTRLERLGKPQPKILEVGGNARPMIHPLPGELYNVDVDVHGLQIGFLAIQHSDVEMKFVCADANTLPFIDRFFDCIVIFSSLHHFPNLPLTLRSLAQKIQPDGFISLLCEPSGHYFGDNIPPDLHAELLQGVNEQTFSLSEYADIFRQAGLEAEEVIVDAGSVKAFLTLPKDCVTDT
ncbi:MAG TPA: methyltransferase domain-containing protein [Allocoleopsis sp.]